MFWNMGEIFYKFVKYLNISFISIVKDYAHSKSHESDLLYGNNKSSKKQNIMRLKLS